MASQKLHDDVLRIMLSDLDQKTLRAVMNTSIYLSGIATPLIVRDVVLKGYPGQIECFCQFALKKNLCQGIRRLTLVGDSISPFHDYVGCGLVEVLLASTRLRGLALDMRLVGRYSPLSGWLSKCQPSLPLTLSGITLRDVLRPNLANRTDLTLQFSPSFCEKNRLGWLFYLSAKTLRRLTIHDFPDSGKYYFYANWRDSSLRGFDWPQLRSFESAWDEQLLFLGKDCCNLRRIRVNGYCGGPIHLRYLQERMLHRECQLSSLHIPVAVASQARFDNLIPPARVFPQIATFAKSLKFLSLEVGKDGPLDVLFEAVVSMAVTEQECDWHAFSELRYLALTLRPQAPSSTENGASVGTHHPELLAILWLEMFPQLEYLELEARGIKGWERSWWRPDGSGGNHVVLKSEGLSARERFEWEGVMSGGDWRCHSPRYDAF